ncbi:MAG: hypothetical protein P4L73_12515 [Caulobacteraceae bacterium]|nr:hypothetical protein [Caulobacteraceae bacterium]
MGALAELGEIGMALARDLRDRALERTAEAPALAAGDVGLAFSRIARAVRLTLALEARIGEGQAARAREAEAGAAAEAECGKIDRMRRYIHTEVVRDVVEEAIEAEADEGDAERLLADLYERLEDEDETADFGERPVGDLIDRIRHDLGLPPDPHAWDDDEEPPPGPVFGRPPPRGWYPGRDAGPARPARPRGGGERGVPVRPQGRTPKKPGFPPSRE